MKSITISETLFRDAGRAEPQMPTVTYVAHDGARRTVDMPVGENVMRGALYNGIEGIVGECGGGLSCATCHCYVDEAWIEKTGSPSAMEREMLEFSGADLKSNSRLSCQIVMTEALDGLSIHMPAAQY